MSSLTAGLLLLAAQMAVEVPAPGGMRMRRGPLESRDEFLLAQARLTLPAAAPDALPRGRTRVRLAGDWGNDFGVGHKRIDRVRRVLYFVDGEHRSGSVQVSHGLTDRWTVQARVPVLWRGGGVMDGFIDAWHRLTGLPNGNRPQFPRDQLSVTAFDRALSPLHWAARQGSGLGGLELGARWSSSPRASGWTAAADGRVQLSTGTAAFDGGGVHLGAQVLAARTLGGAADLYLGAGGTTGPSEQDDVAYATVRPQGFIALEWRAWRPVSLVAQATAAGRLLRNASGFPGLHLTLRAGTKVDVAHGWRVEAGFTEGLRPVVATTDFGVLVGLERTF